MRAAPLLAALLSALACQAAEPLARLYTSLLDLGIPRLRRVAMRNLAMAFPDRTPEEQARIVDGVFRSIARVMVSFARFPSITKADVHEWIRYEGYEHFEEALGQGKGVLFATAHLGNWELSAFAHALMSAPMHVVVRPLDNRRIDALVESRRAASGNHIISKKDFARSILRALKNNEGPVRVFLVQVKIGEVNLGRHAPRIQLEGLLIGFASLIAQGALLRRRRFGLWSN